MTERPDEECPGCGRGLPETVPGPEGSWWVGDGQMLGCGCAGNWSADGESSAWPNHADEDCIVCRDDDIERLEKKVVVLEAERDELDAECAKLRDANDTWADVATEQAGAHVLERLAVLETERDEMAKELEPHRRHEGLQQAGWLWMYGRGYLAPSERFDTGRRCFGQAEAWEMEQGAATPGDRAENEVVDPGAPRKG